MESVELKNGTDLIIGGRLVSPSRSQKLRNHSPDGFAWGYGGSGPSQLALAILLELTDDPEFAQRHYQDFKWEFVATLVRDEDYDFDMEAVVDWIYGRQGKEAGI